MYLCENAIIVFENNDRQFIVSMANELTYYKNKILFYHNNQCHLRSICTRLGTTKTKLANNRIILQIAGKLLDMSKKLFKSLALIVGVLFLAINIIAAVHAYKFSHFSAAGTRMENLKLTFGEELKLLFMGVDLSLIHI